MNLQEQRDVIQALIDGRVVTCTNESGYAYKTTERHFFDFRHNEYDIKPLYEEGEVIMVNDGYGWNPRHFITMVGEDVRCRLKNGSVIYDAHRKQNKAERGG